MVCVRAVPGVGMGIWAGAALCGAPRRFQLYEWLGCRRSPSRRNSTARNGRLGNAMVPSTVAGRRGLLDASIVSATDCSAGHWRAAFPRWSGLAWRSLARFLTLCGLALFGCGWPLCACLGRPKWLRPWFARDELALWRGARHAGQLTEQEAWLESGSRVAEQERRVRERLRGRRPRLLGSVTSAA